MANGLQRFEVTTSNGLVYVLSAEQSLVEVIFNVALLASVTASVIYSK